MALTPALRRALAWWRWEGRPRFVAGACSPFSAHYGPVMRFLHSGMFLRAPCPETQLRVTAFRAIGQSWRIATTRANAMQVLSKSAGLHVELAPPRSQSKSGAISHFAFGGLCVGEEALSSTGAHSLFRCLDVPSMIRC